MKRALTGAGCARQEPHRPVTAATAAAAGWEATAAEAQGGRASRSMELDPSMHHGPRSVTDTVARERQATGAPAQMVSPPTISDNREVVASSANLDLSRRSFPNRGDLRCRRAPNHTTASGERAATTSVPDGGRNTTSRLSWAQRPHCPKRSGGARRAPTRERPTNRRGTAALSPQQPQDRRRCFRSRRARSRRQHTGQVAGHASGGS